LGQILAIQPTFDVVTEELDVGESAVEPSITFNADGTLSYVIQHENEILTSTVLFTVIPPDVPALENFLAEAKTVPNVSNIIYNRENKTFDVVYAGLTFKLIPTHDIQMEELGIGENVMTNIAIDGGGQSLNYVTQQGALKISMKILISIIII